jgi:signal transduction histidine kinase
LTEPIKNDGPSGLTDSAPGRATAEFIWTEDDEDSLRVLKIGGVLAIFMLLAYLQYDQQVLGKNAPGAGLHYLILGGTLLFFGMSWTTWFKRRWKFWVLLFILFLIGMFVLISRETRDPESRFIAIMLCPVATAAFVNWNARWQFVMAVTALLSYAACQYLAPIETPFGMYRWMGLLSALTAAQFTVIFIDRYRRRLKKQVKDLEQAARFRQMQIATMAHDIRSPVAALSGYANLLEEADIGAAERTDLLERIGSTAWNMGLVVSNVLDYYEVQENHVIPAPAELDPQQVLSEVAEECALEARRRGLKLRIEIAPLAACKLDRRHFGQIVRNMLAYTMGRMVSGEVVLRARMRNELIAVEVSDSGASLAAAELEALLERPDENGNRSARRLGLYIARAMAEAAGGRVEARFASDRRGLTLCAELPLEAQPPKARTP